MSMRVFCVSIRVSAFSVCVCICATYADPGMFEGLGGGDAFTGVDGEHLVDQIFGLGSHGVPLRGRKLSE